VYISSDNGESWSDPRIGQPAQVFAIGSIGSVIYAMSKAVSPFAGTYRSIDTGKTWTHVNDTPNVFNNGFTAFIDSGTRCFEAGSGVHESFDSGKSWSDVSLDKNITEGYIYCLALAGPNLLVGTDSGTYLSADMGQNWRRVDHRGAAAFAVSGSSVFGASGIVIPFSTDYGETWRYDTLGYEKSVQRYIDTHTIAASGSNVFIGVQDAGGYVFRSTDTCKTWQLIPGGPNRVDAVTVSGPNLVAGSGGVTGMGYLRLSDLSVAQSSTITFDLIGLSPNPTDGIITIHAANIEHVTVENLLGERVLEVANPRTSEFTLDLTKLPAGIYFARLEMASGVVEMRKIVKE
jgi:photosystem II stability/assembly factor-like uncharacterized protein